MAAYYNENDPKTAAWLRELIRQKLIADGEVDTRSIVEVEPADLAGFCQCHFFAGIGGWSYALRLAGWPDDRAVWTGSCPCQPWSVAGKGAGADDTRDLWPVWFGLIEQCKPAAVFGEQVASPDGLYWLDRVCVDLEAAGYAIGAADLCAAGVGAPINRPRLFVVAQSERAGLEGFARHGDRIGHAQPDRSVSATGQVDPDGAALDAVSVLRRLDLHDPRDAYRGVRVSVDRRMDRRSVWADGEPVACADGWRLVEPGTFPLAHGLPARVGRLRGYGNAIVPQVAAEVIAAYMEICE